MIDPAGHIVAILGGSFNPIHRGHIMLAREVLSRGLADEVWLMISPQNPLKDSTKQAVTTAQRCDMLQLALSGLHHIKPCFVELDMPTPSYSIDSLRRLRELYGYQFRLLIGSDNWMIFDRWKNHTDIIEEFSPIIYPRPGYEIDTTSLTRQVSFMTDMPQYGISSTQIREAIERNLDMSLHLPAGVAGYIVRNNLYR